MKKYRVALIEDSILWQSLIKHFLHTHGHFEVVLCCGMGDEFFEKYKNYHIDLILLDIDLPRYDAFQLAPMLAETSPHIPFIVYSSLENDLQYNLLYSLGAKACIPKSVTNNLGDELINALDLKENKGNHSWTALNTQEIKLLYLVCKEKTNEQIGDIMCMSKQTVEYNLRKLAGKLNIFNSRMSFLYFAMKHGFDPKTFIVKSLQQNGL